MCSPHRVFNTVCDCCYVWVFFLFHGILLAYLHVLVVVIMWAIKFFIWSTLVWTLLSSSLLPFAGLYQYTAAALDSLVQASGLATSAVPTPGHRSTTSQKIHTLWVS